MAFVQNLVTNSGFSWFCFCAIVFQTGSLSILEHIVDPPVVSNCSAATFTCQVDTGAPYVDVWWTFRGENASKLPDTNIVVNNADEGEWQLELKCPTLEHKGSYACNAQDRNDSEIVHRKEAVLKVFAPVTVNLNRTVVRQGIRGKVNLTCNIIGHPLPHVEWFRDNQLINIYDRRIIVGINEVNPVTALGFFGIENLRRKDNGTYVCLASNEFSNATASQDLLVEEPPEVEFIKNAITVVDSSTVTLRFHAIHNGNLAMRFRLEKTPLISSDESEVEIDRDILGNITDYTVHNLMPGITYTFRLSASNSEGNSYFDYVNVSMPADVPPKALWVHILASTNETLLFGWRRPGHNNGATITRYTVELHHHNGSLVANNTIDIEDPRLNNHMYIFDSLDPGKIYAFQVQACNVIGCSLWSEPFEGTTSDGIAEPPQNVEMRCDHDFLESTDSITVLWKEPTNAQGTLLGYNVTLFSRAQYRNENGQTVEENLSNIEIIDVNLNKTWYKISVLPNTEYTVQICTINKSGCGSVTNITSNTRCKSATSLPSNLPQLSLQINNNSNDCRELKLKLQRATERNGPILCYKFIVIKMPKEHNLSELPLNPEDLKLSIYEKVHENGSYGAYVAEVFSSDEFISEVVIGDNHQSVSPSACDADTVVYDKKRHIAQSFTANIFNIDNVQDKSLSSNTNYTGYVLITVQGPNESVLTKTSLYFSPVLTGCLIEFAENSVTVNPGVICGIVLIFSALALSLFFLWCKYGRPSFENDARLHSESFQYMENLHHGPHSNIPRCSLTSDGELSAAFRKRHVDSDMVFQNKFEVLPENFKGHRFHSQKNRTKNLDPDIKAYNCARLSLPPINELRDITV